LIPFVFPVVENVGKMAYLRSGILLSRSVYFPAGSGVFHTENGENVRGKSSYPEAGIFDMG
jgi:hypothetical protein